MSKRDYDKADPEATAHSLYEEMHSAIARAMETEDSNKIAYTIGYILGLFLTTHDQYMAGTGEGNEYMCAEEADRGVNDGIMSVKFFDTEQNDRLRERLQSIDAAKRPKTH